MEQKQSFGGLDAFKLAAALLVVSIHTSPLNSFSAEGDFFLTRVLARVAVPFFFMVTGQFVLSNVLRKKDVSFSPVWKAMKKILLLYAAAILLYLPVGMYAGHYDHLTLGSALRLLIFDGTFYHLWYFPACVTGLLLLWALGRFLSPKALTTLTVVLYLIALLGDSYYGLTAKIPVLAAAYDVGFQVFTYTRNGIFMAPLFLLMGARLGTANRLDRKRIHAFGLAGSLLLMTAEGFLLRHFSLQRHDSMYLLLPVCMFFLYRLLLSWRIPSHPGFRTVSTWVYILHPAVIVVIRGGAKALGLTALLVDNSLVHYFAVCLISAGIAVGFTALFSLVPKEAAPCGRAWIELDRNALRRNVQTIRELLPENCRLMPAVKANAYGHGDVQIAKELSKLGVCSFCVACLSEGIRLRRHGVKGEILILGYTHPEQFPLLRRYRLTQTVVDYPYALELDRYGKTLRVQIGVDTGMHRLGEDSGHIDEICRMLQQKHLNITGLFSHLCVADSAAPEDQHFTRAQGAALAALVKEIKAHGLPCPRVHLQSSYGVLNYPELAGDFARAGIMLYGVLSAPEDLNRFGVSLRPVLSLKCRVAAIKQVSSGESAGYGQDFYADEPKRLAVLTIGYGDGLPRALSSGNGAVLLHGQRAPIVGRICMDQMLVDATNIPQVKAGDSAVLIGTEGEETISVYEIAAACGTITNEILSRLGPRLERIVVS